MRTRLVVAALVTLAVPCLALAAPQPHAGATAKPPAGAAAPHPQVVAAAKAVTPPAPPPSAPPVAAKIAVEDHFFDTTVTEDYRWLEAWSDSATKAWVNGENAYTRGVLDALPMRNAMRDRLAALNKDISPHYSDLVYRGHTLFALKDQPPKNQPMLVALESVDDLHNERVIVDPNALDPSGATTIDFFEPSLDGTRVAVSLSRGGTEAGDLHVYDLRAGTELPDVLPHVNGGTAGGGVAWSGDGTGMLYTRYPQPGERPDDELDSWQQVYFHTLGTPFADDRYVMGKDFPRIAEISFRSSDDGQWALVVVRNGDGGEVGWWLRNADGTVKPVAGFTDHVVGAEFAGSSLLLLSLAADANGEVLRVPLANPALSGAERLVPASVTAIEAIHVAGDRLYVQDISGGPNDVRIFSLDGRELGTVPLPDNISVSGFSAWTGGQCLLERQSYTEPARWVRFDPADGQVWATALAMKSPADYSGIEVRTEFAVSKDGTRVPITLLVRQGTALDGQNPLLLYGYGGYSISEKPRFSPTRLLWIEQGGIWADAHLRGGGDYGDAWHQAGRLLNKQNVFDDFAACAQALVDRKYTSVAHLAIQGGSNGGLLMGAELTQHPDLFGAVVSSVGVYDMLRVERTRNGLFNTTEYGSVKDPDQFRALYGYSPLHHVQDGTNYPPVLLLTGMNDPRVDPWNSFKFAARLQASGTKHPVLLRTSMSTGHIGTPLNARNEQDADIFSFLFSQLGLTYRPVTPTP
jgi:prolyl oligopeptidase